MHRRSLLIGSSVLLASQMTGLPSWNTLGQWHLKTGNGGWSGRDGAGLLSLGDDIYMLGGWNPNWTGLPTTNEVWKSTNRGQSWVQLSNAPWEARHTAGWLVHDGAMWVIGGDANLGHYQRDVWKGTPTTTGVDWVLVTSSAAPLQHGRVLHQVFSHNGFMWIVGGQTLDELAVNEPATKPGSPFYADVWRSTDGATWELVSDGNQWAPRGLIIGNVVKDGRMWLVGGGTYATKGNPRLFLNDTWNSADGISWNRVSASAPFAGRQYHNVVVRNKEIIVLAGFNGANIADAWSSEDCVTWRQFRSVPWAARHAASAVAHKGEVIFCCGPLWDSSVWGLS